LLDGGPASVLFVFLTILTVFSVKYTRRQRDWVELILVAVVALQAPGHIRHLAFFALMFGLRLPEHLVSACEAVLPTRAMRPLRGAGVWLVQAELGLILAGLSAVLIHRHVEFGVLREEYPVDAVEFMDRHQLQGKLAATFDWRSTHWRRLHLQRLLALMVATTPATRSRLWICISIFCLGRNGRGRHRGQDSGPIDPEKLLSHGSPDLVLLNRRRDLSAVRLMSTQPDWSVLYQDGLSVVYGRRSVYDDLLSVRHFPKELRQISDVRPQGRATWPGFPRRSGRDAFSPARAAEVQRGAAVRMSQR
jgi:hypothetical protein